MRKAQPVFGLILLLATQVFCVLPGVPTAQPTERGAVPAEPGPVTEPAPPQTESVGTINLVVSQVQAGPPNNLQFLNGLQDFHNGDGVRVTDGGKGQLSLNDGILLTLFNQAQVSGVNISVSPRETRVQLDNEGFDGYVPPGGRTVVDMPNGAQFIVLGTNFFIKYSTVTGLATAGNYDGTVHFIPPGGPEQELPPRQMVDIPAAGAGNIVFWAIPFTPADFEAAVDTYGTPSAGLEGLIQEFGMQPLQVTIGEPVAVPLGVLPQTGWSEWEQIAGEFQDAPAVASWGSNRLDVFIRALNNELWHQAWDGANWSGWFSLEGVLTSAPAAASWGENRIDVFALGTDRQVWHRTWDGGWLDWISEGGGDVEAGGLLDDAPGVTATASRELYLFVRNSGHNLKYKYWGGESWSAWDFLGGAPVYSSPSVVSRGAGMLDIVARGESGQVLWRNALGDWIPFDGTIQDAPALISWGPERMDLFVRGTDNSLLHSTWTPATSWSDWENLGGPIYSAPAAVSWGPGRIDVFARGEAGNLIHIWYQE